MGRYHSHPLVMPLAGSCWQATAVGCSHLLHGSVCNKSCMYVDLTVFQILWNSACNELQPPWHAKNFSSLSKKYDSGRRVPGGPRGLQLVASRVGTWNQATWTLFLLTWTSTFCCQGCIMNRLQPSITVHQCRVNSRKLSGTPQQACCPLGECLRMCRLSLAEATACHIVHQASHLVTTTITLITR